MPKPVEAPTPDFSPEAANLEDMTQPMGPLEEGDQALVDAVHELPEGQHTIYHELGGVTGVNKSESVGYSTAKVDTSTGGVYESIDVAIDTIPENGIQVRTFDRSPDEDSSLHISGNDISSRSMERHPNRDDAQAIKLEVAGKIGVAAEQLGRSAVKAAQR